MREPVAPEEGRAPIVRVDTRTGQRERWLDLRPADHVGIGGVATTRLSADGRCYVYTYSRELSNLFLVNGLR